jgi:hypothetical protein
MSDTIYDEELETYTPPAQATPAPPPPRERTFKSTRREGLAITLGFALAYAVIGYFTVVSGHIVQFGALERLADAYMSWWNDPPKLAAIGLSSAPVGTLSFLAPALVKPFATSLSALPLMTAAAGGGTLAMINTLLARCGFARPMRLVMIALVGINPMFVFYAGSGSPDMLGVFFCAAALLAIVSWKLSDEARYLIGAGLAMSVAVMVDYTFLVWALALMLTISFIGPGPRGGQTKLRASLLLYLTPVFYSILIWTILNGIILKAPFRWVEIGTVQTATNLLPGAGLASAQLGPAAGDMAQVVLGVAPLLFIALPVVLLSALNRRDGLGFGLFAVALGGVAAIIGGALLEDRAGFVSLSTGLPLLIAALAAMAWVFWAESAWRPFVGIAILVGLGAAIPLSWHAMQSYPHQDQEQAFTRFVESRSSQEGTTTLGGYKVGIDPELVMANYINDHLHARSNSILTDSKVTYGVVLMSGKPGLFVDRADDSEGEWLSVRDDPVGQVRYMLVANRNENDLIRKRYPGIALGEQPGLVPIFHTERYVLVEVEPGASAKAASQARSTHSDQPRLFTPPPPLDVGPVHVGPTAEGAGLSPLPSEAAEAAPSEGAPVEGAAVAGAGAAAGGASSEPKVEGE